VKRSPLLEPALVEQPSLADVELHQLEHRPCCAVSATEGAIAFSARFVFTGSEKPSLLMGLLMGEGLGGGDAAQLVGFHLMRVRYLPDPLFRLGHVSPQCELARLRRRRDAFSCRDLRGGKHHPLPTLPHQGERLPPRIVAVPSKRAVIGSSGMSAQLSAFMDSSQRL
jgi:hypothetical protein